MDPKRSSASRETLSECQDLFDDRSAIDNIAPIIGSIPSTSSYAPKVSRCTCSITPNTDDKDYLEAINTLAQNGKYGRFRPKGFTVTDALSGETSLLGSAKCQKRLKQGDVTVYVDREVLLLKVRSQASFRLR
jgi:hypothetical protein